MNRFKVPRRACGWGAGNGSQWGQAESAPGLGRPCPRLPSLGAGLSRIISVGPGLAWKLGSSFFLRTLRTQHLVSTATLFRGATSGAEARRCSGRE